MPDEEGRITQASKVYSHIEQTEERYRDLDIKFLKLKHPRLLSADRWMIKGVKEDSLQVHRRQYMDITLDKFIIKAGGSDTAVITGAPKGAEFTVESLGEVIHQGDLPNGEIEIGIPVPVSYKVTIRKWPWRDSQFIIQAV